MREILFRGKGFYSEEWVEGYLAIGRRETDNAKEHAIIPVDVIFLEYGVSDLIQVIPETICQYTGMTDKNGNRIWENDIVKRYNSNGDEWMMSKIVWADHSLNMGWCIEDIKRLSKYGTRLFKVGFDVNDSGKCEVIGNIFDNHELLEEQI